MTSAEMLALKKIKLRLEKNQPMTHSSLACCRVGRPIFALLLPIRFISVSRFMARLLP